MTDRMMLRTIRLWAIYNPKYMWLICTSPTKKALLAKYRIPHGCVVVDLKGHYHRPADTTGAKK